MRGVTILAISLLFLLAGCAAPTNGPGTNATVTTAPRVEVTNITFLVEGTGTVYDSAPDGGSLDVLANATLLIMEAQWTCAAGPCTLKLSLFGPDGQERATGTGMEKGRIQVASPEAGTWSARVSPDRVARATGTIRVSVFTGGVPPPGYSAFGARS